MDHSSQYFQDFRQVRQPTTTGGIQASSHNNNSQMQRSSSPSNRRSSTTTFESKSFSRESSPQPNRRYSNPLNQTSFGSARSASCSRSRSPSEPQFPPELNTTNRRFSQPAGSVLGSYDEDDGREKQSLAMKEKESYSSLTCLPEVRAYLKFMEDDIPIPHRSKSFNGRNSSRRSSFNRRKRAKSRTRTPTPTPFDDDDNDSSFEQNVFEPVEFANGKAYGRFLTPQRSSESSCVNRSNSCDSKAEMNSFSRSQQQHQRSDDRSAKQHTEMVQRRMSGGSLIRTTFL